MWENLRIDALDWCEGKSWIWRTILLAYLTYAGFRYGTDSHYASIFEGISFGIHEIGHLLFSPLGKFLMVAGGTITELAAPVAAGFILLRQRDYFGLSVTGCWLSYCSFSVAKYMGDARAQNLPLLGLSDQPEHDWHYLLSTIGLLNADTALAFVTRVIAFAILLASITLGVWLCRNMGRNSPQRHKGDEVRK